MSKIVKVRTFCHRGQWGWTIRAFGKVKRSGFGYANEAAALAAADFRLANLLAH